MRYLGLASSSIGLSILLAGCGTPVTGETATTTDGSETNAEESESGEEYEPIPARQNINLSSIVVNQAVDVPVANNGVWVGPNERNTYVVNGRDTLLRGFWEVPEDWVPRPILARLQLRFPDGSEATKELVVNVEGASFPGDLKRAFNFPLLATEFPAGLKYQMTLWEAEAGHEDLPESTTVIASPASGLEEIGIQPEPAELKIVMFPVNYDNGTFCDTTTTTLTEEEVELFVNHHHEQYPVQEVMLDFRREEPIIIDFAMSSLSQLWEPLRDLRASDQADPNVYYYALVDVCGGGIDDAAGIAPGLATDLKTAAFERVSSGVWLGGDDYAYHTMVHELGHNHGRAHIYCANGDAAGTDPSYPHNDGTIGVWGFGIRLFGLYSPTSTWDIMTYCAPNWVSDWGWSKVFNRIRTLTSWDYEAPSPDEHLDDGEVMIGLIFEDGREEWSTAVGAREPEHYSSGESVRFVYGDQVVDSPSNIQILDDGTTMITTAVPRPKTSFSRVARVDAQGSERAITMQTPESRIWRLTKK